MSVLASGFALLFGVAAAEPTMQFIEHRLQKVEKGNELPPPPDEEMYSMKINCVCPFIISDQVAQVCAPCSPKRIQVNKYLDMFK